MSDLRVHQRNTDDNATSIVDSLMRSAENGQGGIQGILCNDPNGLCLASKGLPVDGSSNGNSSNAGVYTSLVRLANQLEMNSTDPRILISSPLITIETEQFNILVKEYYDGHTVAMRVPCRNDTIQSNGGNSSTDSNVNNHLQS